MSPKNHRTGQHTRAAMTENELIDRVHELDALLDEMCANDIDDPSRQAEFLAQVDDPNVRVARRARTSRGAVIGLGGPRLTWRGPIRSTVTAVAACCVLAVTVVALSIWLDRSGPRQDTSSAPPTKAAAPILEDPNPPIALMDTIDAAPFWYGVRQGYFRDAGFRFDPAPDVTKVDSGSEAVAALAAEKVDIAYSTYTPFIVQELQHPDTIDLVAGASSCSAGSCMLVTMPDSGIRRVKDLDGARIAVTSQNTISDLLVMSTLRSASVDLDTIHWKKVPFRDMAEKLAIGEVDAAFMTEPYLSAAQRSVHVLELADLAASKTQTANMPTAGFGARTEFVKKKPRTIRAFQQVMERATTEVNASPRIIPGLLMKYADVDAVTADSAIPLTFQSSLEPERIQRVADLMRQIGVIDGNVDVSEMIVGR